MTAEALTSLRCLIEHDIDELDEPSKHRVQKLANAAEKRFAECAILLDENKLLFEQNSESNVRKSTKSTVVGKAKVMSWEDLEKAKAARASKQQAAAEKKQAAAKKKQAAAEKKRAAVEKKKPNQQSEDPEAAAVTTVKKPRGRKRKASAEADATASPKVKVARVSDASDELQDPAKASAQMTEAQELAVQALVARMTEAQAAEDEIAARGMETNCSVLSLG